MSAVVLEDDPKPHEAHPRVLNVGLLGCGTVGSPVAQALLEDAPILRRAAGVRFRLGRVAVRDPHKTRSVELPPELVTTDPLAVAIDPGIDIVIEVIGGTDPSGEAIRAALADNKSVITANKELLAGTGADLLEDPNSDLHFEASVCAAIPIIRTLKEYCSVDRIESITGILSGTCNFVLSEMTQRNSSFEEALDEARSLGYAEADATADIDGWDAAAKVAILARVAFGAPVTIDDVRRIGISNIDRSNVVEAASEDLVFKLVATLRRRKSGLDLRVAPQLLGRDHPLARVGGADNAVLVETSRGGRLVFEGSGAGGAPTAAAVLGDLVSAARRRVGSARRAPCLAPA